MSAFSWTTAQFGSSNNRDKLSDHVDTVEYPAKEYGTYRPVGRMRATAMHWLNTKAKPKDGKPASKKPNAFPVVCLGFDPETMSIDASKCPYCSVLEHNPRVEVRQNVIDRAEQENEPRRKQPLSKKEQRFVDWNGGTFRVKDGKGKGGWSPYRVLTATPLIGKQIKEIASLNKIKINGERKAFGPEHSKYGFDVMIKYTKDAKTPNDMYIVQKGESSPLTKEELSYPLWDIPVHKPETFAEAEKQAKRLKAYLTDREGNLMFPDAGKESKKEGKKKNQYKDSFDEDDDVEDDDDEGTSRGKKRKAKSNWDDDDDDDGEVPFDVDDDEDEDERPRKSSKSKTKSKLKTKTGGVKIKLKSKSSRRAIITSPNKSKIRFKSQFRA